MRSIWMLLFVAVPLLPAIAADVKPTKAMNYSKCKSPGNPYGYFTGSLNDKGDLDLDPRGPGVSKISNSDDGKSETVLVKSLWKKAGMDMTYVLEKKDGHPDTLNVTYKKPFSFGSLFHKGPSSNDPMVGSITRFGYKGDDCYVAQTSSKLKSGMEVVTYDREACDQVLAAVKRIGAKKVMECGPVAYGIQAAVNLAEQKVNGPNKKLALGSYMGFESNPNNAYSNLMGAFTAASTCAITLKMYGESVDPETDVVPKGGFMGNSPDLESDGDKATEGKSGPAQ